MSGSEISQLLLHIALATSIFGISIQIMRLLGTTNDILKDARHLAYQVSQVIESISSETENIAKVIGKVGDATSTIQNNIFSPIKESSVIIGTTIDFLNKTILKKINKED